MLKCAVIGYGGLSFRSESHGLVSSSDLPLGDTCPLRVLPQAGAAASPRDKSGRDGALPPVASGKPSIPDPQDFEDAVEACKHF